MNDRRQHMLDRAKKLMAIANDEAASVNEAAMALSQAQKIMDQYALETWMLEQDGTQAAEPVQERHIAAPNKGNDRYFLTILDPIAKANACRAFRTLLGNRQDGYTLVAATKTYETAGDDRRMEYWKTLEDALYTLSEKTLTLVYEDFASMLCQGPLETILYKRQ